MLKNFFSDDRKARTGLVALAMLLVLTTLSSMIAKESIRYLNNSAQRTINEAYTRIRVQLETQGLDSSMGQLTKDYAQLLGTSGNIVITDDGGRILYQLNTAYIVEPGRFLMLADPYRNQGYGSDLGFIIDSRNDVKYAVQYGVNSSLGILKAKSSKNPVAKALYQIKAGEVETLTERVVINSDGSTYMPYADTSLVADYGYIASRRMNLYSLYDVGHLNNRYYTAAETLYGVRKGLNMLAAAELVLFLCGLAIYRLFRHKSTAVCGNCLQPAEYPWSYCPFCGHPLETRSQTAAPEKDGGKQSR